jgi:Caspase domain
VAPHLPDPQASAAVLIGASTYRHPGLDALPAVANNVADLSAVLTDLAFWGLPPDRSSVVLDQADYAEVINALVEQADRARDTFLVYFSGHGLVTPEGELVLATPATDPAFPKYTALPYAWIRDVVGRCRATRRIVILDCCFSGRALHAMSDAATAVIGQVDVSGIYVLTSAPANSVSYAPPEARHTAFTGGLLDILRNGVPGVGELLSLDDVYDHALLAMAKRGWPRPQRLGTNTIGRLGILRNRAFRKIFRQTRAEPREQPLPEPSAEPPADALLRRHVAEAVREAVAVVAATLGRPDQDGLLALDNAFAPGGAPPPGIGEASGRAAGVALVRETMLVMRQQFGDGAVTAAVILGVLVEGLHSLLAKGEDPHRLNAALDAEVTRLARELRRQDAPAEPTSADDLRAAAWTALGQDAAQEVLTAVGTVGAGNVEVLPSTPGEGAASASGFVLDSRILAPNAASGPIALEDPLVVVSVDGQIDAAVLRAAAGDARPEILIVAPRVSIFAMRGLLHAFSRAVVVRPADASFDLAALRDRLGSSPDGNGWARARRALVLPDTTTIDQPAADLELARNRITLTIPGGPGRLEAAVRTLAVARSVSEAGTVPGGGGALRTAVQAAAHEVAPDSATAALVNAAALEPYRLLQVSPGRPAEPAADTAGRAGAPVDSLATARGALTHAAATAGRFLSGA